MRRHLAFALILSITLAGALMLWVPFVIGDCFGTDAELAACMEAKRRESALYLASMIVMLVAAILVHARGGRHILGALAALALVPFTLTLLYANL